MAHDKEFEFRHSPPDDGTCILAVNSTKRTKKVSDVLKLQQALEASVKELPFAIVRGGRGAGSLCSGWQSKGLPVCAGLGSSLSR